MKKKLKPIQDRVTDILQEKTPAKTRKNFIITAHYLLFMIASLEGAASVRALAKDAIKTAKEIK